MKIIIALILVSSCYTSEIQVKSTYATVLEITTRQRYGFEEVAVFHLRSANGIPYYLELPLSDTIYFRVGGKYSFLSPK